ncbi:hypothetical protein [Estrella lausannensis]|uniref:Putative membrane protein n=1 Tax=Estrella lausannensis TaxID=483423 RepID=A0A0H5DU07_9BACT|nr:hypothetical protein [Estrella lausannensis]CRX39384.1 putative membrane protein [Estrella lausannensis]
MPAKGNQPINLSDIIGLVVAFLAFVYMALRPFIEKRFGKGRQQEFEEVPEDHAQTEDDEWDEDDFESEPAVARSTQPSRETSFPSPPKKREKDRFRFQSTIEKRRQVSAVEQRKLQSTVADRRLKELEASFEEELTEEEIYNAKDVYEPSRAALLLNEASLRRGILLSEILGKPKALYHHDGRVY